MQIRKQIEEAENSCVITYWNGDQQLLTMVEDVLGSGVTVRFRGELRSEIKNDLLDELGAFVTALSPDIRLDFKDVTYMAPSIQGALIDVQMLIEAQKKGSMVICNTPAQILEEFAGTGQIDCLEFEE